MEVSRRKHRSARETTRGAVSGEVSAVFSLQTFISLCCAEGRELLCVSSISQDCCLFFLHELLPAVYLTVTRAVWHVFFFVFFFSVNNPDVAALLLTVSRPSGLFLCPSPLSSSRDCGSLCSRAPFDSALWLARCL